MTKMPNPLPPNQEEAYAANTRAARVDRAAANKVRFFIHHHYSTGQELINARPPTVAPRVTTPEPDQAVLKNFYGYPID